MPTFNDVPQELWNRIVKFFEDDSATLLNLCLTSPRFVDEAQSYLYSIIRIVCKNTSVYPHMRIARSLKLFSTFTTHNPSVAKHVKVFIYDNKLEEDDPTYEDLRIALRLMVNVTWLEIFTNIPHVPQGFFDGCTFRLRHFRCVFASSDIPAIYKMLSTNTKQSLRYLYIDGLVQDFPSDCGVRLRGLYVEDWRNVLTILPGRSILGVELLRVEPFFEPVPPSITLELGNLTHFTFKTHTPYDFLEHIAPYLKRLIVLRIIGKDDEASSGKTISGNPEVIYQLTNLKVFVWSLQCKNGRFYHMSEQDHELFENIEILEGRLEIVVAMWFEAMPKLKIIYIRNLVESTFQGYPTNYTCWERDGESRSAHCEEALGGKSFYTGYGV